MKAKTIQNIGRKLRTFLVEFEDCISHSEERVYLKTNIDRQLQNLQRKSIELIAQATYVLPRTLLCFLSTEAWDSPCTRVQLLLTSLEKHLKRRRTEHAYLDRASGIQ